MLSECIKFLYCDVLQNSLLNDKDYMEQIHQENIAASNCYKLAPKKYHQLLDRWSVCFNEKASKFEELSYQFAYSQTDSSKKNWESIRERIKSIQEYRLLIEKEENEYIICKERMPSYIQQLEHWRKEYSECEEIWGRISYEYGLKHYITLLKELGINI